VTDLTTTARGTPVAFVTTEQRKTGLIPTKFPHETVVAGRPGLREPLHYQHAKGNARSDIGGRCWIVDGCQTQYLVRYPGASTNSSCRGPASGYCSQIPSASRFPQFGHPQYIVPVILEKPPLPFRKQSESYLIAGRNTHALYGTRIGNRRDDEISAVLNEIEPLSNR